MIRRVDLGQIAGQIDVSSSPQPLKFPDALLRGGQPAPQGATPVP